MFKSQVQILLLPVPLVSKPVQASGMCLHAGCAESRPNWLQRTLSHDFPLILRNAVELLGRGDAAEQTGGDSPSALPYS